MRSETYNQRVKMMSWAVPPPFLTAVAFHLIKVTHPLSDMPKLPLLPQLATSNHEGIISILYIFYIIIIISNDSVNNNKGKLQVILI